LDFSSACLPPEGK